MLSAPFIQQHLALYEPEQHLLRIAPGIRQLYETRFICRQLPCTDFVVRYLARLVIEAVENQRRFRSLDCLKIIRHIIRREVADFPLSQETANDLFQIYRHFVFSDKEEIQWCVSTYLKDRPLRDWQIDWLIEHVGESIHLVNRLLRYPLPHVMIAAWAKAAYLSNAIPDRNAEILGVLIQNKIPDYALKEPSGTLVWAVFYSKTLRATKERLLLSLVDTNCMEAALEVALRLAFPSVVNRLYEITAKDVNS